MTLGLEFHEQLTSGQDLAQFEPDPGGDVVAGARDAAAGGRTDDPQWIVWRDAASECAWAARELEWARLSWQG